MKTQTLNKVLLLFSSLVLFLIALTFGAAPEGFTTNFYHLDISNINAAHTFRSVMGLIFGGVAFWVFGAFNPTYSLAALYSLMFTMFCLVFGRAISFLFDAGQPITIFAIYITAEFATGLTALLLIKKNHNSSIED